MFIVGAVLLGLSLALTTWAHLLVGRAGAGRRLPIFRDPPGTPKLASWLRMGGALLAVVAAGQLWHVIGLAALLPVALVLFVPGLIAHARHERTLQS
ncbi:hypothetical protein C5C17_14465 [Pseudoclavibacter sp. RFBA6]|nr:hypothetical protein C5C17_14465 [Pseudoclavibacter sp. RFBA6]